MADYLTLTEFVPGTKAKAQEVNANFSILKDAINSKASKNGDSTQIFSVASATADLHAVNKKQLDTLANDFTAGLNKGSTKFCVKSGNLTSGKGDLFSYDVLRITPKIGGTYASLIFCDYEGTVTTISSTPAAISMTGKPDGVYNIYIKADGTLYTLGNKIYRQPARPTMLDGDIWFNTSIEPLNCIKYDGTSDIKFLDMPLGKVTIANSIITALETFAFNQNGYNVNMNTLSGKFDYANPVNKSVNTNYTAECDGILYETGFSTEGNTTITIDGVAYTNIGYSVQGEYVGMFVPISKGQIYSFSGNAGRVYQFIPHITV